MSQSNEFSGYVPTIGSKNAEYNAVLAHGGETSGALGTIDLTAPVNLDSMPMSVDNTNASAVPTDMLPAFYEFMNRKKTLETSSSNNNINNIETIADKHDFRLSGKRKLPTDTTTMQMMGGVKMPRQEQHISPSYQNFAMAGGAEEEIGSSGEEDEEELKMNFSGITFPTKREIVAAEIFPLSRMEQHVTYAIIKGTPTVHAFVDKNGKERSEPSILLKVAKEGHFEDRFTVRAFGIAYKHLMYEAEFETYKDTDDYFITYRGMKTGQASGHEYHDVSALHRKAGAKKFRPNRRMLFNDTNKRQELAK